MKNKNLILPFAIIFFGIAFSISKFQKVKEQGAKIVKPGVVQEVPSPEGHQGSKTIANYKLKLNGTDSPPHIPVIHDCIYDVIERCQKILNLDLLRCINGEQEHYDVIYNELTSKCKTYAEYRRICTDVQMELCGNISLKDNLRCMHKNFDSLNTRCQVLLRQILLMYGVDENKLKQ